MTVELVEVDSRAPKILIIGGGAVAIPYAWRLQKGGAEVSVVCRSNYGLVAKEGFMVNSEVYGTEVFKPNKVFSSAAEFEDDSFYDYIFVCTKTLPTIANPADEVQRFVKSDKSIIVLIQNGIGIEKPFVEHYPKNPLISAIAYVAASRKDNIINYGKLLLLEHAIYKSQAISPESGNAISNGLQKMFNKAGIDIKMYENSEKMRWRKLVINATFNPITVVAGGYRTDEILLIPEGNDLFRKAMRELLLLARIVLKEPLYDVSDEQAIDNSFKLFATNPLKTINSTLSDFLNKKPLEHEVMLKNAIEIANKHGFPVPILSTVYTLLVLLEKKNI
ncbi:hypothetical protein BB560_000727 [Smittium megazygosporum]|uniref:2-dehydropantoate 2-reductase n=1 Tax=Smittium megazygosporum TaxID=133381 RepID=A0A2T9ZJI5_9FUNG|nr:hypothetical protein BB560_000727 [Smittium megazygosporum]